MKITSIIGLLTFLITSSCIQRESKTIISDSAETKFKSGLLIENGINRGTSYTDSLETRYNIRYIPIRVTNDTIIPIRFDLAFSNQYKYPVSIDDTSFSVVVLPKEWIINGSEVTDQMFLELPNLLNKPS